MGKNVILAGASVSLDPPVNFPIAIKIINRLKQVIWLEYTESPMIELRADDISRLAGAFIRCEQRLATLLMYDLE